jgi:hypothetical protein
VNTRASEGVAELGVQLRESIPSSEGQMNTPKCNVELTAEITLLRSRNLSFLSTSKIVDIQCNSIPQKFGAIQ